MASVPTFQSNPYGSFDPSQWSNPYSRFQNQALPWPASYAGWPTDATGQPIQPQPGMTLNSQPQAAQPAAAQPNNNGTLDLINTLMSNARGAPQQSWGNNQMGTGQGTLLNNLAAQKMALQRQQQQPAATPAAAAPANSAGLSSQQYLQLLANPGTVQTPGATVPQSGSAQPGPGVLQQFLQNWRPAQSGPGSGFANAFYRGLGGT